MGWERAGSHSCLCAQSGHGWELRSVCPCPQGCLDATWVTDPGPGREVGGSVLLSSADSYAGVHAAPRPSLWCLVPRTQSCSTASPCASSCRPPAKSCPTRCTSMMLPAVSLPVSPRKSLLPEKVEPLPTSPPLRDGLGYNSPFLTLSSLSALATLKPQAGLIVPQAVPSSQPSVVGAGEPMDLGELVGMTPEIIQKRGKTVPEELVKPEELSKYRQVASHVGLHSASIPGILALDLCPSDTNKILTGGADKNVVVFDKSSEQILATLKGHTKKVTSVVFHPSQELVFSASPDATIRIWSVPNASCVQVVRAHESAVTGLSLHATGDYLLSSSDDQYWAFSDIQTGRVLTKVTDETSGCSLTCAQFHPDGLIFGTGTMDSQIKIWDLKERTNVANFPGHSGPITSIAFSENGYYLATAADDSSVKLWDLRKLKNFKTLQLDNNFEVKSLIFDQSGTYLALGGTDVQIYICKQWTEILHFTEHSGVTTGVAFGHHAKFIASTGMDRSLKFYSL
uniref:Pre-mRNA-processing factor 19 n=1 Tax=Sus scrofa TaxID=9823 RepID=A0A8D1XV54_PIG